MNKEAELLCSLGLPVWLASYEHNMGSSSACSNIRATEVVRKGHRWVATNGKRLPDNFIETQCIHPTKEAAIAHYNRSIDDTVDLWRRMVENQIPHLLGKKYKV